MNTFRNLIAGVVLTVLSATTACAASFTLPTLASGGAVSAGDLLLSRQGADTVDKKITAAQLKTYMLADSVSKTALLFEPAYYDLVTDYQMATIPEVDFTLVAEVYGAEWVNSFSVYASTGIGTAVCNGHALYNNGASGVGATLTCGVNGQLSIDNVSPPQGSDVLLEGEEGNLLGYANGIYLVTDAGSVSTPFILTRETTYDEPSEVSEDLIGYFGYKFIIPTHGDHAYQYAAFLNGPVSTIGVDAIAYRNTLNVHGMLPRDGIGAGQMWIGQGGDAYPAAHTLTGDAAMDSNGAVTLHDNTVGVTNIILGYQALQSTSGGWNIAVGNSSLTANTTATDGVAVGDSALKANTTGWENTAVGSGALETNITGVQNTAIGAFALYPSTGSGLTAVGDGALNSCTTCPASVAIGYGVGHALTTGSFNTAVGYTALLNDITGHDNTAMGNIALLSTTGNTSTAIGAGALWAATTGNNNTSLGYLAGASVTTGSNNTMIGGGVASNTLTTGSDNIVIGVDTSATTAAAATSNTAIIKGTGTAVLSATGTDSSTVGPTVTLGGQTIAPGFVSGGTKFTSSGAGCTVGSTIGGATAGQFTASTTGTCTTTITMNGATGMTAPNGWACWSSDITTGVAGAQSASSTTTATIKVATTSGNTVSFGCIAY